MSSQPDGTELETRLRRSYRESGDLLVREMRSALVARARRRGLPAADAEDAAHETPLALLVHRPEPRSLVAWLYKVLDRRAIDAHRQAAARRRRDTRAVVPSAANDAGAAEDLASLAAAVAELPPREREAVRRRYLPSDSDPPPATAAAGATKRALARGLRRLRRALTACSLSERR